MGYGQFSAFLKVGLLEDMLCLFDERQHIFYTLVTLGENVCGHPSITHGGVLLCCAELCMDFQMKVGDLHQGHVTSHSVSLGRQV